MYDGLVLAVGRSDEVHRRLEALGLGPERLTVVDAAGGTVTPGLIDPHTHLLFAGTRESEWQLRREGQGYLEILAGGGGILATVARTRAASPEALHRHGRRWLEEMLHRGVTTVEAKSGYGLDLETELRLLEVAGRLGSEGPVEVAPTYLGAHAVPPEYRDRPDAADAYVLSVVEEQLPAVAAQGTALFCDVFCEPGVFTV
ncbi:MAG: amidohydrolase family protein, partial [Chloroflexota bacterium]|nr:amidohydrolase family protein [Chloroflexota bacterium]